ncbi:MAG TPA: M48 family metalloprotease [Candidatus Solibacter sp.]|nr:M48 family metalloprotease [Candidatus Solibacter sp.]
MTRWILLSAIVALGIAAVVVSERRKVEAEASPAAVLYLVADTEHELTRMPSNFTRMSDAEEIRIGDEIASSYGHPGASDANKEEVQTVEKYLNQVGGPLAARAHRSLPFRFHYIPSEYMINAFALPGGHVYVGGGLLALMDSEDELAAVLGHEIEHIDHYHCAERAQQEEALRHIPLGGLVALPIFIFEAGYSKDQELEADREGTRLAVNAGYSANGAIRMFEAFDRMYRQYMGRERKPASPQEEASNVALQTLEGYFRSHPLPAERIAQVQKMSASESWTTRPERDLAVAYIFWTARAKSAMQAKKYSQAEELASRSLKMRAEQPEAEDVLALAQFAQANFSGAAATLRKMMEGGTPNPALVERYAMALAAADRKAAAGEFRDYIASIHGEKPRNAEVEQAGLNLLAGDSGPASTLDKQLRISGDNWAPDYMGELGWWYYLTGDSGRASQLLNEAVQLRPGNLRLWVRRAWIMIEIRRYSDALQTTGNYEEMNDREKTMAEAVARWQAREQEAALVEYDKAMVGQPQWGNPEWVKALYSPLVAQSVQEMREERERQKKAKMAGR